MKLRSTNSRARSLAGISLLECIVYLAVFAIIIGIGTAAFFKYWDNSKALRHAAGDIVAALRAGERWRADIRSATGKITVETTPDGQLLRIPRGTNEMLYSLGAGEIRRKMASANSWIVILPKVKTSHVEIDNRNHVTAWRWEVELAPQRVKTRLHPLFTFEAVPSATP